MATKRQHYVAQHYLKAWADASETLAVCRIGETPKRQLLWDTAVINRLYSLTVPSLEECNRIKTLCDGRHIPSQFVKLLFCCCFFPAVEKSLLSGQNKEETQKIAAFLVNEKLLPDKQENELRKALASDRTGFNIREIQDKVTDGLEPFLTSIENNFAKTLDSLRDNPCVGRIPNRYDLINYLAVQKFRTPSFLFGDETKGNADLLIESLGLCMDLENNFGRYEGKIFDLGNDNDYEFITSDNPVIDFSPKLNGYSLLPQLFFPITPKTCLVLSTTFVELTLEQVQLWNEKVSEESDTEIYATNTAILGKYSKLPEEK